MKQEDKRKLLEIIESNVYFGELTLLEVVRAATKGMEDSLKDEELREQEKIEDNKLDNSL